MAAGTIESMVCEAADECGWDDITLIEVLEDFFSEYADTASLRRSSASV